MDRSPLSRILPPNVAVVESDRAQSILQEPLFPAESASLGRVSDERRREFVAGRGCARRALALLGEPEVAIPVLPSRAPDWPKGVVGSITHTQGYVAAAVARRTAYLAIGIDAEFAQPLDDDVLAVIATKREREHLAGLPEDGTPWDCLLLSAKESLFKVWWSFTRSWLGFEDATIVFDVRRSSFMAQVLADTAPAAHRRFPGRYVISETHVFTCFSLPA